MQTVLADNLWVLFCACLVFFMHAGFALVESGLCRRKNVVMVLLKNVSVVAIATVLYYAMGYAFMFGDGCSVIGLSSFWPAVAGSSAAPENLDFFVFLFFQLVFAATAATIVSGAVAERVRFMPFMIFVVAATGLIYPMVGHWVWGGGWLSALGFHDFAGSTVVHAVGGAMGLAGVKVIGPRYGKFGHGGNRPMPAHNIPLAALGVLILWLGWFGFNGGSTLSADTALIGHVIFVTNMAAAAGFLAALLYVQWRSGGMDFTMALNGALAGLVAITAGADVISPTASVVVGVIGGVVVVEGVYLLNRLRADDPVGAIPVHLCAGLWGTCAVGIFSTENGLLYGGGWTALGVQALGGMASACVAGAIAWIVWRILNRNDAARVSLWHERDGLDSAECGIDAYDYEG